MSADGLNIFRQRKIKLTHFKKKILEKTLEETLKWLNQKLTFGV